MNTIFPFLLLLLFALNKSSNGQLVVGKLEGGKAILTIDKSKLLAAYNTNLLKQSNIDGKFTEVSIKCNESNLYFLVFQGGSFKSTFSVVERQGILSALDGTSCTTSDCATDPTGCVPVGNSCTACSNKGKCTKTISSASLLVKDDNE